jgi:hypothetical protein
MSWFKSAPATTAEQEDPKGTKKFQFSFGNVTRGQLQQMMEDILSDRSFVSDPLAGAEKVLKMFSSSDNAQVLAASPTVQGVVLGTEGHEGPVTYFLRKAVERQEAKGAKDPEAVTRYTKLDFLYRELIEKAEVGRVLLEDPDGTKKYAFSFGTMTGSGLQQRMEDTLRQYSDIGMYAEGAQKVLDMITTVPDKKLLMESPRVQSVVLGGRNGSGPVDYFLAKAREQLSTRGGDDKAPAIQLDRLERQYGQLRDEVYGQQRGVAKPADKFELRIFRGEDELGR